MPIFLIKTSAHLGAFLIGVLSLNWMLLGISVAIHFFVAPTIVADARGMEDYSDLDADKFMKAHKGVLGITIFSSFFSGIWFLLGAGLGFLF